MRTPELLSLLQEFHRERLGLRARHEADARFVPDYDANNTYQYIIAREDVQLGWLDRVIRELGGEPSESGRMPEVPTAGADGDRARAVVEDDVRLAQEFVDRWRPRVEGMSNARHRRMLDVILGETLEHKRFFEQAAAGRDDVLGRRADGAGTPGAVLASRWIE